MGNETGMVLAFVELKPVGDFQHGKQLFLSAFTGSPPNRKRPPNEKATDDYHYEKFKKMNRRY